MARAERIGDAGVSAPENWKDRLASDDVHALVFSSLRMRACSKL